MAKSHDHDGNERQGKRSTMKAYITVLPEIFFDFVENFLSGIYLIHINSVF